MKKQVNKKRIKNLIYPITIVVFYALGGFICSMRLFPHDLVGNFFFGISELSLLNFSKGWLYHFFPFLFIFFSGYDYLGKVFTVMTLAVRSYLSGYSGCACITGNYLKDGFYGIMIFVLFTFTESMILIILLSGAVEQDKFRSYYISKQIIPFKSGANKFYIDHNLQRCGILILLYIFRSFVCYIM